jgi:hypothetical protein
MTKEQREKLRQLAEAFIAELPPEYIETVINDHAFIVPFEKPVTKASGSHAGISAVRLREIENKAIQCRNHYYTGLLREELKKIYKKTQ